MAASSPAEGGIDGFLNQISTAFESIKGFVAPALTGGTISRSSSGSDAGHVAMVGMNSTDMLRSAAASVSEYSLPTDGEDYGKDGSRQLAGKAHKKGGSTSAPDLKSFSDASDSDSSRHGPSDQSGASSRGQPGVSGNGRQPSAGVSGAAAGATAAAVAAVTPAANRPRSALEEARSFLPAFMLLYEECFGEVDVPMDPLALLMVWTEQRELERLRMEHEKGMAERGITQHLRPPPPLGDLCKAMRHSLATYGNTLNNIRMGKTSMAVHAIHKVVDDVTAAAMGDDAAAERNATAAATIAGISRRDILSARWASERFLPGGYVAVDHDNKWVVLAVRGSLHITDALTNVHAKSVPFLGGWAHEGMAIAARHTAINHLPAIGDALRQFPDYSLVVTGHSLGAGVAALVAMLLHSNDPCVARAVFQDDDEAAALRLHPMPAITGVRAFCFAPPCVISNTLAQHCAPYVKSVVCGKDVVPRLSISNFKRLVSQLHGKAPVNKALKAFGGAVGGAFTGAFLAGSSPPTGPPRPKLVSTQSSRAIASASLSNDEQFKRQQRTTKQAMSGPNSRTNSGRKINANDNGTSKNGCNINNGGDAADIADDEGEGEGEGGASGHWTGRDDIDGGKGVRRNNNSSSSGSAAAANEDESSISMPSLDSVVKMFSRMSPPWATLTFGADEAARTRDPDGAWSLSSTPSSSSPPSPSPRGGGMASSMFGNWRSSHGDASSTVQMEHCLMDGWWEVWPSEGVGAAENRGVDASASNQGQGRSGDDRQGGAAAAGDGGLGNGTKAGSAGGAVVGAGPMPVQDKPPLIMPSDWGGDLAGDKPFAGDKSPSGSVGAAAAANGDKPSPGGGAGSKGGLPDSARPLPRLPPPPAPAPFARPPSTPGPGPAPGLAPLRAPESALTLGPVSSSSVVPAASSSSSSAVPTFAEVVSRAALSAASAATSVAAAAVTTSIAVAAAATSVAATVAVNSVTAAAAAATVATAPAASITGSAAGAAAGAATNAAAASAAGAPPAVAVASASIDAQMAAPLVNNASISGSGYDPAGNRQITSASVVSHSSSSSAGGSLRAESGLMAVTGPLGPGGADGDVAVAGATALLALEGGGDGRKDGKRKLEVVGPLSMNGVDGPPAAPALTGAERDPPSDSSSCPMCGLRKRPETLAALASAHRPAGQPPVQFPLGASPPASAAAGSPPTAATSNPTTASSTATNVTTNNNDNISVSGKNGSHSNSSDVHRGGDGGKRPTAVLGGRTLTGDLSNLDDLQASADATALSGGWWRRRPGSGAPPPPSSSSPSPSPGTGRIAGAFALPTSGAATLGSGASGANASSSGAMPGTASPGMCGAGSALAAGDPSAQQAPSYAAAVLGHRSKAPVSPGGRPGVAASTKQQQQQQGIGGAQVQDRGDKSGSSSPLGDEWERGGRGGKGPVTNASVPSLSPSPSSRSTVGASPSSAGPDRVAMGHESQGDLAAHAPHVTPPTGLAGICNCDPVLASGVSEGVMRDERAKANAAARGKAPLAVLKNDRTRFVDQGADGAVAADSISLESSISSAHKDLLFPPGEIVHVINPTTDTPLVVMRDQTAFTEILLSSKMLSDHLPGVYLACLERLHLLEKRKMQRTVSAGGESDRPQQMDEESWLLLDGAGSKSTRKPRGIWDAINGGSSGGETEEGGLAMSTSVVTRGYSPAHFDGQHARQRHVHLESLPEFRI